MRFINTSIIIIIIIVIMELLKFQSSVIVLCVKARDSKSQSSNIHGKNI